MSKKVIVLSDLAAAKYASVHYSHSGWWGKLQDGVEEKLPSEALEVVDLDTLIAEFLAERTPKAAAPKTAKSK